MTTTKPRSKRHNHNRLINFAELRTLLTIIETRDQVRPKDLINGVGCSRASIYRLITIARDVCGMVITYDRLTASYRIDAWGVFDRAAFLRLQGFPKRNAGVGRAQTGAT